MSGHMRLQVWKEIAEEHDGSLYPRSYCADGECCPAFESTGKQECGPECRGLAPIGDERGEAWFAEYTAPGYMDKTDFVVSTVGPIDAAQECFALYGYGDDEKWSDERTELAQVICSARRQGFRR